MVYEKWNGTYLHYFYFQGERKIIYPSVTSVPVPVALFSGDDVFMLDLLEQPQELVCNIYRILSNRFNSGRGAPVYIYYHCSSEAVSEDSLKSIPRDLFSRTISGSDVHPSPRLLRGL